MDEFMTSNHHLIPDWVIPKSIGLVWPGKLPDIKLMSLTDFYIHFIRILIDEMDKDSTLTILHRPGEKEKLKRLFGKDRLNLIEKRNIQDIWIKDYAPFWKNVDDRFISVKPRYYPDYGGETYLRYSIADDDAGYQIAGMNYETLSCDTSIIKLDGGNLTHNGQGTAICTNRLISSNEYLFYDRLIEAIEKSLLLKELIIVPAEYGDDTGHIDGMVRFISEDSILVSEYPYSWESNKGYIPEDEYYFEQKQMNDIAGYLENRDFTIHRIPNDIPLMSDFESAVGNYMNFLRIDKKIFIPQYNNDNKDLAAMKAFKEAGFNKYQIIPAPDCNNLAELGGVLNCITTHIYEI